MTDTSSDNLRDYINTYHDLVHRLNKAIEEECDADNIYRIAKAKVVKLKNQKDLIKEKIMSEKKLIDATR